jgi:hypothetical protein
MQRPSFEDLSARLEDCLTNKITDAEMGRWAMLGSLALPDWWHAPGDQAALAYFLNLIFEASPEDPTYQPEDFRHLLEKINKVLKGTERWQSTDGMGGTCFKGLQPGEGTMREKIFEIAGLPWNEVDLGYKCTCEISIYGREMRVSNVSVVSE